MSAVAMRIEKLNCSCRKPTICLIGEKWQGDMLVRVFTCVCSKYPTLFDQEVA
jgi:hypothetical protein